MMEANGSNGSAAAAPVKRTGGVADYFAILGVGEKLVWKHTQKKNGFEAPSPENDSDLQEDEAALMERFYREIVDVAIITTIPDATESKDSASNTASRNLGLARSYTHDGSLSSSHASHRIASNTTPPQILPSPTDSDATTAVTMPDGTTAVQNISENVQVEGFKVVSVTCPAGRGSDSDPTTVLSVSTTGLTSVNDSVMSANSTTDLDARSTPVIGEVWSKKQVFDANLDPVSGLRGELVSAMSAPLDVERKHDNARLRGLGRKVGSTLRNYLMEDRFKDRASPGRRKSVSFHVGYRRRNPEEMDRPAIADLALKYVRIHKSTVCGSFSTATATEMEDSVALLPYKGDKRRSPLKRGLATSASIAARVAEAGKHKLIEKYREAKEKGDSTTSSKSSRRHFFPEEEAAMAAVQHAAGAEALFVPLEEFLALPKGFTEWSVPREYELLRFPHPDRLNSPSSSRKTFLVPHREDSSGAGVEAFVDGNSFLNSSSSATSTPKKGRDSSLPSIFVPDEDEHDLTAMDPEVYLPQMLRERLPELSEMDLEEDYIYVPIIAVRRQRVDDEERYHEDPGIVDLVVSFCDHSGSAVMPDDSVDVDDDDADDEDDEGFSLLGKTTWSRTGVLQPCTQGPQLPITVQMPLPIQPLGTPLLLARRNLPNGFADAPFATRVLDRFPLKNYKERPMPEEELPMFCYPTGCRLHRAQFSDCPLAQYYGFVVKNERGDSIHVSCVSFMEPLTTNKIQQLAKMSLRRCRTSIPHRRFCAKRARKAARKRRTQGGDTPTGSSVSDLRSNEEAGVSSAIHSEGSDYVEKTLSDASSTDDEDSTGENFLLTGFCDMTTFENKTICLISRYPFWTAFRRFLSHLHIMSGSTSDLPLERWISHLLLTVPVPKPGGPCVLVPLPTLNGPCGGPMVLEMPPSKDLPLVDLPFQRLLACLDVPTIVTVVLGFLALERKVIIMSTRPSLVLDGCELLRSLLFPFDLCAPYVPRLTEPFMSCLDFPGAIFVGIHDDGCEGGLASTVRKDLPEDSAIIDLDTGEIDCSGDRYEVLKQCWGIIPSGPRSQLVSEIETLCRDAGIVPGQEPLDSQIDSAFDAPIPSHIVEDFDQRSDTVHEQFDDRGMRDSFLRFFCSVLGGYERYLVVPDVDFLISGNEWFDSQGFLSTAPQDKAPFLGSLVTTQLFQSFIQRRTEASDVHCLLFDECLAEFHSSPIPYGRLGGDVETTTSSEEGQPQMLYSILVDQCAAETYQHSATGAEDVEPSRDGIGSDTDSSANIMTKDSLDPIRKTDSFKGDASSSALPLENDGFIVNNFGDIVTVPSRTNLVGSSRFVYCVDGNPCFPQKLSSELFFPREPESLLVELSETPEPLLSRSDREVEEAHRRRKMATSYRGLNNQRRCMWQLPKLMGSHFLGSWLMCIPSQVSQPNLSQDQQSRFLLRGLGALRTLRNRQRIVPDEAAYRALMVACGRTGSDRRVELVKLFGLLRSDGIFPSAVTLGQYTRAIAEGFSKRSTGKPDDVHTDVGSVIEGKEIGDVETVLNSLDGNLEILEDSGQRWRQRESHTPSNDKQRKRSHQKSWVPVAFSSSFVPTLKTTEVEKGGESVARSDDMQFIALWSRTRSCDSCFYIPLDEEVQSGWDVVGGELDVPGSVSCPRCGSLMVPKIGYSEFTFREALQIKGSKSETTRTSSGRQSIAEATLRNKLASHRPKPVGASFDTASTTTLNENDSRETEQESYLYHPQRASASSRAKGKRSSTTNADFGKLPPQVRPSIDSIEEDAAEDFESPVTGYVTYVSPAAMRASMERHVNERGEAALERETLRKLDPELFYNFLWYCARFSLPLPLPIHVPPGSAQSERPKHCCAFAAWDRTVAERGCHTAALTLSPLLQSTNSTNQYDTQLVQGAENKERTLSLDLFDDFPLLARFNLQGLSQGDWDHPDLSEILVTLVEACDKRDFRPVIECVLRCNMKRRKRFGLLIPARQNSMDSGSDMHSSSGQDFSVVELDCYRTCLYLAKYQCTTAFHAFFPAVAKPCKGYHFWCPTAPLPIFDRLFRDAVKRIRSKDNSFTPLHDVSDVALGFRCVFGHLI